jgi:hypothetical protein
MIFKGVIGSYRRDNRDYDCDGAWMMWVTFAGRVDSVVLYLIGEG